MVRAVRGDGGGANQSPSTTQGLPLKNAKERMDVIAAYQDVGTYPGVAAMCGTTHKTVRWIIEAHEAASSGKPRSSRQPRPRNYEEVAELVAERVEKTAGKISAKRLLPAARAAAMRGRIATSVAWSRT
jgi:hypothetical protein